MRVILIGCEYTGKTTLAKNVLEWIKANMGNPICGWHDHFVLPFIEGTGPEAEEEAAQVLSLKPSLLEKYARYMIHYHLGHSFYLDNHHLLVNWYYGDAVYAPLYYGYGGIGQYADRRVMARYYDAEIMRVAPDTVLVLMKASAEVIRRRMQAGRHPHCILKEHDVELVLQRFEEEYDNSLIRRRFVLDTTEKTPEETFREFLRQMEPHLTPADQQALLVHGHLMKDIAG